MAGDVRRLLPRKSFPAAHRLRDRQKGGSYRRARREASQEAGPAKRSPRPLSTLAAIGWRAPIALTVMKTARRSQPCRRCCLSSQRPNAGTAFERFTREWRFASVARGNPDDDSMPFAIEADCGRRPHGWPRHGSVEMKVPDMYRIVRN
jgi:hypothetical protein